MNTEVDIGTVDVEPDFKPPEGDAKKALREQLRRSLSKREAGSGMSHPILHCLTFFHTHFKDPSQRYQPKREPTEIDELESPSCDLIAQLQGEINADTVP